MVQKIATLESNSLNIMKIAYSPDGRILASAEGQPGAVVLWDVETHTRMNILAENPVSFFSVAFSPNGGEIAAGNREGFVNIWHVETGELHKTLVGHRKAVISVAFARQGAVLLSTSSAEFITRVWDIETGQDIQTFDKVLLNTNAVLALRGNILTVGKDNTIENIDLATGETKTLLSDTGYLSSLTYSHDGNLLAGITDWDYVHIWDVRQGRLRTALELVESDVCHLLFQPCGTILACAHEYHLTLWNTEEKRQIATMYSDGRIHSLAFDPGGHRLAFASGSDERFAAKSVIELWDVR